MRTKDSNALPLIDKVGDQDGYWTNSTIIGEAETAPRGPEVSPLLSQKPVCSDETGWYAARLIVAVGWHLRHSALFSAANTCSIAIH